VAERETVGEKPGRRIKRRKRRMDVEISVWKLCVDK